MKVKAVNNRGENVFIKHSIANNYRTCNNLLSGQSFNENLLYLSPVLKKGIFY
jgi:hypothetical protein